MRREPCACDKMLAPTHTTFARASGTRKGKKANYEVDCGYAGRNDTIFFRVSPNYYLILEVVKAPVCFVGSNAVAFTTFHPRPRRPQQWPLLHGSVLLLVASSV